MEKTKLDVIRAEVVKGVSKKSDKIYQRLDITINTKYGEYTINMFPTYEQLIILGLNRKEKD